MPKFFRDPNEGYLMRALGKSAAPVSDREAAFRNWAGFEFAIKHLAEPAIHLVGPTNYTRDDLTPGEEKVRKNRDKLRAAVLASLGLDPALILASRKIDHEFNRLAVQTFWTARHHGNKEQPLSQVSVMRQVNGQLVTVLQRQLPIEFQNENRAAAKFRKAAREVQAALQKKDGEADAVQGLLGLQDNGSDDGM